MAFIILIVLLITILLILYCFLRCFFSLNNTAQDPYGLLNGNQYQEVKEKIFECTQRMESVPFEPIHILSHDKLSLYGRYYHVRDGAPIKIIFHGYRSMALRDCAGGIALARKLGWNVLAVDQRAHGKSGGHVITFGILERYDCLAWIHYLCNRFGSNTKIVLSGLSMGAATVIMSLSLPLPSNVKCVLADCPYSSPKEIIQKVCQDQHLPANLAYPFIHLAARLLGGFSLNATSAVKAIKNNTIPVLLLHGTKDHFVPCSMSQQIYNASNKKNTHLETFPDAGHGLCYLVDPNGYEDVVINFLKKTPDLQMEINETFILTNI